MMEEWKSESDEVPEVELNQLKQINDQLLKKVNSLEQDR